MSAESAKASRDNKRGAPPRPLVQCGEGIGAARRHQRAGEPLCALCKPVWQQHQAAMYQQRRDNK